MSYPDSYKEAEHRRALNQLLADLKKAAPAASPAMPASGADRSAQERSGGGGEGGSPEPGGLQPPAAKGLPSGEPELHVRPAPRLQIPISEWLRR